MHLVMRPTQREDGWITSSIVYVLDAKLEASNQQEQTYFAIPAIATFIVHNASGYVCEFDPAYKPADAADTGLLAAISDTADAIASATSTIFAALLPEDPLAITIGDLIVGRHIETDDRVALADAASSILAVAKSFSEWLEWPLTIDARSFEAAWSDQPQDAPFEGFR